MVYLDAIVSGFIGRHAEIILFWGGYIQFMAFLSVMTHIVLFKFEINKKNPQIPYIQDVP